jgi:hypothetical protein
MSYRLSPEPVGQSSQAWSYFSLYQESQGLAGCHSPQDQQAQELLSSMGLKNSLTDSFKVGRWSGQWQDYIYFWTNDKIYIFESSFQIEPTN